jgi:hypothetical protein
VLVHLWRDERIAAMKDLISEKLRKEIAFAPRLGLPGDMGHYGYSVPLWG